MRRTLTILCGLLIASSITMPAPAQQSTTAPAQAPATQPAEKRGDARAWQVLEAAAERIGQAERFRVKVAVDITVQAEGMDTRMSWRYRLAAARPNRILLRQEQEPPMFGTLASDGKQLTIYMPMANSYLVREAPKSLDKLVGGHDGIVAMGNAPFVAILVMSDPLLMLRETMTAEYLAEEQNEKGEKLHHLRLTSRKGSKLPDGEEIEARVPMELWIRDDPAVLVRFVPDVSQTGEVSGDLPEDMQIDYEARLEDWDLSPELDEEAFAFTPPAGAKQVESMEEMFGPQGGDDPDREE